ncbi:MAG: hypothetical protein M5U28_36985 [Sandaracinaceae bacterium]|nr:hypothetical protein [Sandaracinaceae bacterium]
MATRSSERICVTSARTASRAWTIFSPLIEPLVSSAIASATGRRAGVPGTSFAERRSSAKSSRVPEASTAPWVKATNPESSGVEMAIRLRASCEPPAPTWVGAALARASTIPPKASASAPAAIDARRRLAALQPRALLSNHPDRMASSS